MATSNVHAQLIRYADNGDQMIINLKSAASDISLDRSSNGNLPSGATTAQGLANALGALAFKSSLSKTDVGLGSVDNTSDANKSVKYATTAGSANSVSWENVSNQPSVPVSGDFSANTLEDLLKEVQGHSPRMGSAMFTKDTRIYNSWYNFVYIPHRTGVGGDNKDYGTLVLFPMVFDGESAIIRAGRNGTVQSIYTIYSSRNISEASVNHANAAGQLDSNAGSSTQPIYFNGGKPVACSYTLGKSVPSNAVFSDTWRGIQNNLTSTSTSDSLSAAQGKILNESKLTRNEWNVAVKGKTWSRLCYVSAKSSVTGSAFLLNIFATRGNVVYNNTFMIKAHHSSSGCITKLSGSKYGSTGSIRLLSDSSGNCYVEYYDDAYAITSASSQAVNCTLLDISAGGKVLYTTFTDGSSVPSGFAIAQTMAINTNSLQGELSWGEVTGKPSTYPSEDNLVVSKTTPSKACLWAKID